MTVQDEFKHFATRKLGLNSNTLHHYISANGGYVSPTIIEERQLNVAQMDVFSRLMMDRIIFLGAGVDDYTANVIQAQLLFLDSSDAGYGIYDTMQYISCDVSTICTGMAASMAAVLLVAGTHGKRFALPHSRVMIHQPLGGMQGQASDIEIAAKEILRVKGELYKIISEHSGQPLEVIERDSDRDKWMTAEEAQAYGMIDKVLSPKPKKEN